MKKKFNILFLLLIAIFSFVACENTTKSVYDIIYMSKGEEITHTPDKYTKGIETTLIPLNDTTEEKFIGWYKEASFKTLVTSISKEETGVVVLFAKWEKISIPSVTTLKDALNNMNNYAYSFVYNDQNDSLVFSSYIEFANGSFKNFLEYEGETYYEYLADVDGKQYYYGLNADNAYYSVSEDDEYFENYVAYFDSIYLDTLDPSKFELQDGAYKLIDESLTNEILIDMVGEFENSSYQSLEITLKDDVIFQIKFNLTGSTTYHIVIEFSNVNKTSFTLPNVTPLDTEFTCKDVVEASDGETVCVTGTITGIVGNNFYIESGGAGLYIYCGSKNDNLDQLLYGKKVTVTGTKTTYKGLVEVQDIQDITVKEQINSYEATLLDNLSQSSLNDLVGFSINYQSLIISSLPNSFDTSKDISLTVTDGTNETTLFISKYLSNDKKNEIISLLEQLDEGSMIDVNCAVISVFNKSQIALTEFSQVFDASVDVYDVKIETVNKIKVKENTSFEDVVKNLTVTLTRSNKTTRVLNSNEYTLDASKYQMVIGEYEVTVKYNDLQTTFIVEVTNETGPTTIPEDTERLTDALKWVNKGSDYGKEYGIRRGLPSVGTPKILVIPVAFSDYAADKDMKENLERAFFGEGLQTGWESLNSYYKKTSYGKLDIKGQVLPVFETNKKASYYDNIENGDYEILKAALEYYDSQINYADFDSDKDGYIDAIYLVYTAPIDYEDDNSIYWAYTTEYYTENNEYYDNVEADFYLFAGYDFLFTKTASNKNLTYNLETFIHESGHLLGLDDYYDYDTTKGPAGGLGGGDMMDNNVGDHNAFSKAILGWINPLIMESGEATITLKSFGTSGDALIIAKKFEGSLFTEYFIIDFYTPDGLNEMEKGQRGLFSTSGIRIYHIDATLKDPKNVTSIFEIYEFNNTDTQHKLISLVEADGRRDVESGDEYGNYSENSDLFQENDIWKTAKWYDGTSCGFTLKVEKITSTEAVITITF